MARDERPDVTVTEAAAIKGVPRTTIHRAIREGRLPAHPADAGPIRRVWMICRSDLDAYKPADRAERLRRATRARHPGSSDQGTS